mgnify:CR=1 FL=1
MMNPEDTWTACLQRIKGEIPHASSWFKEISTSCSEQQILLEGPKHAIRFVANTYSRVIEKIVSEAFGSCRPTLEFKANSAPPAIQVSIPFPNDTPKCPNLNYNYRFDNFVIGQSNEIAYNATIGVAESPGSISLNPLVLHSNIGLGKTHLLHAIGNYCYQKKTAKKIVYVTSEEFFRAYLTGVSKKDTSKFHNTYRNADILLMDDIQFYIKTEACQRELLHTFNSLFTKNKQIVFTCDDPASTLKFENQLISRFQSGVAVSIDPPDFETRVSILRQKASELHLSISDEILNLIAEKTTSHVRALEGALKRLNIISGGQNIDIETAKSCLSISYGQARDRVDIKSILRISAKKFNLSETDLVGKSRKGHISEARQIAMYLSRFLTKSTFKEIGAEFGDRDHATVIHAVRAVEKRINCDSALKKTIETLRSQIPTDTLETSAA